MRLVNETGGPAVCTPKKAEEGAFSEKMENDPAKGRVLGTARCQFCDKEILFLRLCCSKCKQAFYCDKEFQGKDWKRQKKTCKAPEGAK